MQIAEDWLAEGFFIKRILDILDINRSTYYARVKDRKDQKTAKRGRPAPGYSENVSGNKVPDAQIEEYLMEYYFDCNIGALGYRKWTSLLRKQKDLVINYKKVFRLCKELGILKARRLRKPKHPRRLARNRSVTGPNQLWQVDIKYGNIVGTSYFIFVCSAIDVYDRKIVGYYRGATCQTHHITGMLTKALIRRKVHFKEGKFEDKLIIRTDNGPQFVSDKFGDYCQHQKVYHERIPVKTPDMNAYIESFHAQLQRECFDRHVFHFYEEAYYYIDDYIQFYNTIRPHGSLNNHSPEEFFKLAQSNEIANIEVSL